MAYPWRGYTTEDAKLCGLVNKVEGSVAQKVEVSVYTLD